MAELYESRHTGAEIDDTIDRAKVGGEIDAILNAVEYSAAQTYALGDYCKHAGKLYHCTTAITEAEDWTEAHWTETSVTAELIAIYTALQNKADLGEDGKVPAEQVDAYSKADSLSASTRTALSLAETATPDAALSEIARQLSESSNVAIDLLWENASLNSSFAAQTITLDLSKYTLLLISYRDLGGGYVGNIFIPVNDSECGYYTATRGGFLYRNANASQNSLQFHDGAIAVSINGSWSQNNEVMIPGFVYGVKL